MKKLVLSGSLALILSASLTQVAEAKFFLGLDVGYDYSKASKVGNVGSVLWGSSAFYGPGTNFHSWVGGINLGTSHNITESFGLRWILGANYSEALDPKNTLGSFDLYLGVDTLFNFVNTGFVTFGGIVGLEANFTVYDYSNNMFGKTDSKLISSRTSAGANARLGFGLGLGEHNRLEFLLRIPVVQSLLSEDDAFNSPLRFTIGYKVLF